MKKTELSAFEKIVLEQFKSGKSLFGEGGAFAPMLKNVIEKALEGEMDAHLGSTERSKGNKRNGRGKRPSRVVWAVLTLIRPKIAKAVLSQS